MGSITTHCFVLLLGVFAAAGIVAGTASAAPVLIDFESEVAVFVNVPNGFTSVDSPDVHFSDTSGADLLLVNDPIATAGSNALAVLFDNDDSGLLIELDFRATEISLDFGNDAAGASAAGDLAVLTTYLDGSFVAESVVAMNRNSLMDQSISYVGSEFNSAVFKYAVNPQVGLTEAIDNISITPSEAVIPEPTAAAVFGVGALLVGCASGRRPRGHRR